MTVDNLQEIHKYNGFKLISLDLRKNSLMGKNKKLFYDFIDPQDKQSSIYTTVIIGPNGTGKSNLFRIVIELFKELHDLSNGKKRSYNVDGRFNLKFSVNGDVFVYSNIIEIRDPKAEFVNVSDEKGNPAWIAMNGNGIDFKDVQLPLAIIASAIMLTDKYPFFNKENDNEGNKIDVFPQYKYLGARNIAQGASTRAYVRKTVELIIENLDDKTHNTRGFIKGLEKAMRFLEVDNSISIYYQLLNAPKFFRGKLDVNILEKYFFDIRERYLKSETNPPYKLNYFQQIELNDELLQSICDFCNKLYSMGFIQIVEINKSKIYKISYDILDEKAFSRISNEYKMLEHLRKLGLISAPEIQLKQKEGYSLQESSSGEYHFFSSIVGLMASIKTNSLIFIDEPEISLHPNWQMKYLSFIRELFSATEYNTCHIIVATHSHFLISDLKGDSSKIIGLKRVGGEIEMVNLPKNLDTFGWSAEDVLYKIFGLRTTRNHYMEVDMRELLHSISEKKQNKSELEVIIKRLESVKLNNEDPLNLILTKAKDYIQKL